MSAAGIGIEVTPNGVRAVVVDPSGATVGTAAGTHDGRVEGALVRVAAELGPIGDIPARLAWEDPATAVEAVDVTGAGPAELGVLFRRLAADGVAAVMIDDGADGRGRRRAVAVRWDARAAGDALAAAVRAGFAVTAGEPAGLARARVPDLDAARGAAVVAAGAVPVRPLRDLGPGIAPAAVARPWVVERLPETDAAAPAHRSWWRPRRARRLARRRRETRSGRSLTSAPCAS